MNLVQRESKKQLARVMVPVHGYAVDKVAISLACEVARKPKAQVYALYVIEVKRTLPLDADLPPEAQRGEEVLLQAEGIAEEQDYKLETELLQAREAGPAIVDEACERGIDLIIMGVPYKRHFGEFSLGSIVPYVLKNAPCEVWLCREAPAVSDR